VPQIVYLKHNGPVRQGRAAPEATLAKLAVTQPHLGVDVRAFERLGTHRERFGLTLEQMTPAAFS